MNKIMSLTIGAAMLAGSLGAIAPATAAGMGGPMGHPDMGKQQAYVMQWCGTHKTDSSCNDFNSHHHNWSQSQYNGWYSSHRSMHGFDPGAAAFFGITAAIGGAIANSQGGMSAHQRACEAKYGASYDPATNMYKLPGHAPRACVL